MLVSALSVNRTAIQVYRILTEDLKLRKIYALFAHSLNNHKK